MSRRDSPEAPSNRETRLPDGMKSAAYELMSKGLPIPEIANELRVTERKLRWMLGMSGHGRGTQKS